MKFFLTAMLILAAALHPAHAQDQGQYQGPTEEQVADRAQGADRVVLGTVFNVQSRFAENEFGDRLIVSDVLLRVDEEFKGPFEPFMAVTVEGGEIGNLRLDVSDLPSFQPGDRGVFFLEQQSVRGRYELHRRDLGLMRVTTTGQVDGALLSLNDVRRAVRDAR